MKKTKTMKICGILLALIVIAAFVTTLTITASAEKAGDLTVTIDTGSSVTLKDSDGDGYYDIGTADQLYAFAAAVNGGKLEINGELISDITVNTADLSALGTEKITTLRAWIPIGQYIDYTDTEWAGEFDGNEYTISGIYCYGNADGRLGSIGLFGYIAEGGAVRNVNLENSYFFGDKNVGSIAYVTYGTIENCHSDATVYGDYTVGGIVSMLYDAGIVTNCSFIGKIKEAGVKSSQSEVGGIAGYNSGEISYSYFDGSIVSPVWEYVGGISGGIGSGGVIRYCYNVGGITGDLSNMDNGYGGILGSCASTARIESCYSTWRYTSGSRYHGGILGWGGSSASIINCVYLKDAIVAGGNVQGPRGTSDNVPTSDEVNKYVGVTDFSTGEVTYLLNGRVTDGTQGFFQAVGSGMPSFEGPTVYLVGECSDIENVKYTNVSGTITHVFEEENYNGNGICPCGAYEPAPFFANYYEISKVGHLYWFKDIVINNNNHANARLMNDIVFNEGDVIGSGGVMQDGWNDEILSIGSASAPYEGRFDGQGYTLSGIFQRGTAVQIGIFYYIGEDGVIENVNIDNSYFESSKASAAALAYENCGIIRNCTVNACVVGKTDAGGVVKSVSKNGIVEYVCFKGSVTVCERSDSSFIGAGGIASNMYSNSQIRYCIFEGEVSGTLMTGGIIAIQSGGQVSFCLSNGTITDCKHNTNVSCTYGSRHVGGITGYLISGNIKNCLTVSTVAAENCGGIVGVAPDSPNIQNCYYLSGCATTVNGNNIVIRNGIGSTTANTVSDIEGCTTGADSELLASGEIAYKLNGDQTKLIWKQKIGTDPVPSFEGDEVNYDIALDEYLNHRHEWIYSLDNGVIKGVCNNDCLYTEEQTLEIALPENLVFDESFKEIVLSGSLASHKGIVIKYEGEGLAYGKPYYIGEYKVTVSIEDVWIEVEYTVTHEHTEYTYTYVDDENHTKNCVCGYKQLLPHVNEDDLHSHCDICKERIEECNSTNGICEHGCYEIPTQAEDGYYEVSNAGQLIYYFENIGFDKNSADYIRLVDDIDITGISWNPPELEYGVFDGNGYTINIVQDWTDVSYDINAGLFECLYASTVKNLKLTGEIIANTGYSSGALAGVCYSSTIEGVVSYVDITNLGDGCVGGLVGDYRYSESYIKDCAVYADVKGYVAGGIAGSVFNAGDEYSFSRILFVGDISGSKYEGAVVGQIEEGCRFTKISFETIYYWVGKDIGPCGYAEITMNDFSYDVSDKPLEEFTNYTMFFMLGKTWGQTVGVDIYPVPGGPEVYYGFVSCAEDASRIYTNNPKASLYRWSHDMADATCTEPKTCKNGCGYTEGEKLGHDMADATCTEPKTCKNGCGYTEGEKLGHDMADATCTDPRICKNGCGHTEGEKLGHDWTDATYDAPKTCSVCGETEGEPLPVETTEEQTTEYIEPETTESVESETTEPVEPETTEPVEPETTEYIEPETTESVEPETTEPVEPETTEPVEPETTEPVEPGTTEPVEPETTESVEPETTEPIETESTEPVETESTEPVETESTEPTETESTEPETTEPTEPETTPNTPDESETESDTETEPEVAKKKGCSSSVGFGALTVIISAGLAGVMLIKNKKEE